MRYDQAFKELLEFREKSALGLKKLIDNLRKEVVLELVNAGSLDPIKSEQVLRKVNKLIDEYKPLMESEMSENQQRIFKKTVGWVNKLLKGSGVTEALPFISEAKYKRLQNYGAELITNLTNEMRKSIANELQLSVLGQKNLSETIAGIGKNLKSPSVFGTIAKRAEVIQRTEVNRINQLAMFDRLEQAKLQGIKMNKKWLHSYVGVPRTGHLLLHNVVIPYDQKFKIISEDGTRTYYADFPHDITLPVGEVVNCRCLCIPVEITV
jgi:ribosomal protein S17E